jgi:hypothetical protein
MKGNDYETLRARVGIGNFNVVSFGDIAFNRIIRSHWDRNWDLGENWSSGAAGLRAANLPRPRLFVDPGLLGLE